MIASAKVQNEVSQKNQRSYIIDKCASVEIRKSLEPLLLPTERSQVRWFDHVSRMPQEKLPNKLYLPKQMGKKQLDDLELISMNQYYIEKLGWNCLGLHPSEMMGVMEDHEV